jgi:DNA-binding protein H-NS
MPKINLSKMDIAALATLRKQVDVALSVQRTKLEKQLQALGSSIVSFERGRGAGRRSLKGTKVAPKYRGPSGETWAGRGATPRWLEAAIKEGKKLESFLIDKSSLAGRKKRRSKR